MELTLLGPLTIRTDEGAATAITGRRVRTLLSLLALDAGRVVAHRTLIDQIWGEQPPDRAANALQALVSRLRRQLPAGAVTSHPAGYQLAIDPEQVDLHRFTKLVTRGRSALAAGEPTRAAGWLAEAIALWHEPPLAGLDAGLAQAELARLTELRVAAVEDWSESTLTSGDDIPLAELEAVLTAHPTRERAAGLLIRALCAAGRPGDALQAYERIRRELADRFGADPSPHLAELHRRVLRRDPALQPPAAEQPVDSALRAELTSFVGRDPDLAQVAELLRTSRLTTLVGPGGAGKTRLAREVARRAADGFPDGVRLVELAPHTDPAHLPYAVLTALEHRDQARVPLLGAGRTDQSTGPDPWHRLVTALTGRRCLLLLDNCEHLVTSVALLAHHLLTHCPQLRILATSREPLQVGGETVWQLEPLGLPAEHTPTTAALAYPALLLLADRAGAARPGLRIDETNAATAVRICRALDGMPLAIELAAARLRTMSLSQLADRLDDRFRLLTNGDRAGLPRHRTLRATVDWSWELLAPAEQTLLRRLSVFSGTISQTAAEAVCAGPGLAQPEILDLLTGLTDKSLLAPAHSADDQLRFQMLQTIRAYAREKLAEAGEADRFQQAHTDHFLVMAEAAEPLLRTGAQRDWLRRLRAETDNLHGALRRAISAQHTLTAVRLVAALGWFWSLSGRRLEGVELAQQTLALPGEAPRHLRGRAYTVAACTGVEYLDEATIEEWFGIAAELAAGDEQTHPMLRMVGPLQDLFRAPSWQQTSWRARPPLSCPEVVRLFTDPDPWIQGTSRTLWVVACLHTGGDQQPLTQIAEAGLAAFQLVGDGWGEASARHLVAELAAIRGDLATAIAENRRAVLLAGSLGIAEDTLGFQARLAEQLWCHGQPALASAELAEARIEAARHQLSVTQVAIARVTGDLARLDGDLPAARTALEHAVETADRCYVGPEAGAALATARAHFAIATGDHGGARAHLARAATLPAHGGCASDFVAWVALGYADLALAGGDATGAAELLGASETIRGYRDRSQPDAGRIETATAAALGEVALTEARGRGRLAPDRYLDPVAPVPAAVTPAA